MSNRLCIFPSNKKASADAYAAACNTHYSTNFEQGGQFSYVLPNAAGEWVTPFYGPPWEFVTGAGFTEPSECAALRDDGELRDSTIWPGDEE